jgi:hypothetical protein
MSDIRLISREAAIKILEDLLGEAMDEGTITEWPVYEAYREMCKLPVTFPVTLATTQRMSRCSSCGRTQPSDPTSKYFVAAPDKEFDSDWCGCERGSGT